MTETEKPKRTRRKKAAEPEPEISGNMEIVELPKPAPKKPRRKKAAVKTVEVVPVKAAEPDPDPELLSPQQETLGQTLRHARAHDKYLIDITLDKDTGIYERVDSWTSASRAEVYSAGYREAEKFLDDLRYTGVAAYIRMHGFIENPPPNGETSATLCDFYMSDAPKDFQKGLTKTSMAALDKKQLMVLLPVIIGLVLGAFLLFRGGI